MDKRLIITVAYSTLGLFGVSGTAMAGTVGRFECNVVGAVSQDPIGDKDDHRLTTVQYSCFGVEGPLKDALYSGAATSEWDGPEGWEARWYRSRWKRDDQVCFWHTCRALGEGRQMGGQTSRLRSIYPRHYD